ncbi:bifunctional diguanylate cyclase/phosphodiesterase [Pseudalkalibacillus caeni]|uniref:bifunctional diguanylate cyclase/phosphodiesterase n=1 Tax=Exobacillus caeni TaxID=2574798 RepID=UPI001484F76B|nr:bifunctional diguanylate cyclase/phosphodiesterase [Pseudalkalibacillus caeni]
MFSKLLINEYNQFDQNLIDKVYQPLFSNLWDAVFLFNDKGNIVFANDPAQSLLDLPSAELKDSNLFQLVNHDAIDKLLEILYGRTRADVHNYGLIWRNRKGNDIATNCSIIPVILEEETVGVYVIARKLLATPEIQGNVRNLVTDHLSDMVVVLDSYGNIIYISPSQNKITGYTIDFIKENGLFTLIHPEDARNASHSVQEVLETGKSIKTEFRYIHKEGGWIIIEGTVSPILKPSGEVMGVIIVSRDVTERKAEQKHLDETLKELSDIKYALDQSSNVVISDEKGIMTYVNEGICQLSQYTKEELLGKPYSLLFPPDHSKELLPEIWATISQGKVWSGAVKNKAKDGTIFWEDTTIVPFLNKDGKPYQYIGIRKDITEKKQMEIILERSQSNLQEAQRMAHMGSWEYNIVEDCSLWSSEAYRIFGVDPASFKGTFEEFLQVVHPDDRVLVEEKVKGAIEGKEYSITHRIIKDDHNIRFLFENAEAVFDEDGRVSRLIGTVQDVTEKVKMEEELRKRKERFKSLVKHSYDVISIVDEDGTISYENPAFERIFGYTMLNKNMILAGTLIHEEDKPQARQLFNEVMSTLFLPKRSELRIKKINGAWVYCEVTATNLLQDPSVKGVVLNYRDITRTKLAQEQIQKMAYYDHLTELPNRRLFERKLDEKIKASQNSGKRVGVMFLDLDRFKYINDTLGHAMGDRLIQEAAKRIKKSVGEKGFVSRLSGDEFTVIMNCSTVSCVKKVASKILSRLEEPFIIEGYEIFVTTSIGISMYPDGGEDSKSLMINADLAMYRAKEQGKNTFVVYSPYMKLRNYKSFSLQNDLKKAIERDQLTLHYQPRVHTNNNIVGAEALIRWNHPEWGYVSPSEFIPLAEESGMIIEVGEWVLRTACKQNVQWEMEGFEPIVISVNFSAVQFLQLQFVERIEEILNETGMKAELLEVELTESAFINNQEQILRSINDLKSRGIKVAIDDFGTGYSGLSYLRKFKVNTLKIDRSFIIDITNDIESKEIAAGIIGIARKLNLTVVAEGVETKEQLDIVREMDCDEIQGYYFSEPVKPEEFHSFLTAKK